MKDETEPGRLAAYAPEALQLSKDVQREWGSTSPVRPCIAQKYTDGEAKGGGRNPSAFMIAVEAVSHLLSDDDLYRVLRTYNTRLDPPLPDSELRKVIRQAKKEKYHPFSCHNPQLANYCIGPDCPHTSPDAMWRFTTVSANGLTRSGWLPHLSAVQVKLFLGLYRIARLKGLGPRHPIHFTYRELERVSGVSRKYHRSNLVSLLRKGLLADLCISTESGKASSFSFPETLPIPPINEPHG